MISSTTSTVKHIVASALLLAVLGSCTTVLVRTTGAEGITEDPTERTAGAVVEAVRRRACWGSCSRCLGRGPRQPM